MHFTHLKKGFPNISLQTVSTFTWLTKAFFHSFKEDYWVLNLSRPLSPGHQWYNVFGFDPAGSISSSSTLQFFLDASCKPLVMVTLPTSLSALSFPMTPACPEQYIHRSLQRLMSNIDTCMPVLASHSTFHFFSCVEYVQWCLLDNAMKLHGVSFKNQALTLWTCTWKCGWFWWAHAFFLCCCCLVSIILITNLLSLVSACPAGCLSKWAKWLQQLWEQLFC